MNRIMAIEIYSKKKRNVKGIKLLKFYQPADSRPRPGFGVDYMRGTKPAHI